MSGNELGEFLRARRLRMTPAEVGLPEPSGRRRLSGLRREDVAQLASISTDFYARLEQGRRQASQPVLQVLADVLRLDPDERVYLFGLSGKELDGPRRPVAQTVQPPLRRLLDDLSHVPAVVIGRCTDILAWNDLAAALFTDFAALPVKHRNFVRLIFCDPSFRALYADWEAMAHSCVAQLRMQAARDATDPRLAEIVGELSLRDDDFRRWWGSHHVAVRNAGEKVIRHPVVGELRLDWSVLLSATDSDQQLVTLTADPGTAAHDGLRLLASWAAQPVHRDQ